MRDLLGVLGTAGRLFLRHWPALVTLALLAGAARNAIVWAAIQLSDVHAQLGQLAFVLAPLGFLLPIVVMLLVCRRSLPAVLETEMLDDTAPTEGRRLRLVDVAVSLLVPFLAVYESLGLLGEDLFRFRNNAAGDQFAKAFSAGGLDGTTADRLGIYPLQTALLIVLGAWVLRWLLGRVERRTHLVALAFVGAFVELFYTVQLASQIVVLKVRGEPWLRDRVAARWVEDGYDAVAQFLGPLGGAFRTVAGWIEQALGSFEAVVVVPVAWMAFAAVVLGYRLITETDDGTLSDPAMSPAADPPRRSALRSFRDDVKERWSALFRGLRLLFSAGLVPMLLLSLVFLIVLRIPALVHPVVAAITGPLPATTWFAIDPYEFAAGNALSLILATPLLAATVDHLVRARTAVRSQVGPTTPAPV